MGNGENILPVQTKNGIKVISVNLLLPTEDTPVIWRGPVLANMVKQFWQDVLWGDLDYLFVDMPPGTGDIHLTLAQSLPISGAIIVSTPGRVAVADVVRGVQMFQTPGVDIPVLGFVENMAYFIPAELPNNKYYIFGRGGCRQLAEDMQIPLLAEIPLVQSIAEGGDNGVPPAINPDQSNLVWQAFDKLAQNTIRELCKYEQA